MAKEIKPTKVEDLYALIETCQARIKTARASMATLWEDRLLTACFTLECLETAKPELAGDPKKPQQAKKN